MSKTDERAEEAARLATEKPMTVLELRRHFKVGTYRAQDVAKVAAADNPDLELAKVWDPRRMSWGESTLATRAWHKQQRESAIGDSTPPPSATAGLAPPILDQSQGA